ncbi:unnamed protein product [Porites evermanni]|uniref:Uncharacterized protein n=1 Tax=Porites evermanni TaxID=104178 RepID=A0ABN8LQ24_9CNID|nr:unnamed protein product [Porites evermanni]
MIGAIPKRVKSYLEMGVFVEEEERRPEAAPATEVFSLLNKLNKSKATGLDKISDLSSNVCENNPYKSMPRNTEYNIVLDHVPKTECYKGSFSYRGGML